MKRLILVSAVAFACLPFAAFGQATTSFEDYFGPRFAPKPAHGGSKDVAGLDTLHRWNRIAIDATGLDHTPTAIGPAHQFGEQLGPGRAARAMAVPHVAMFDALNGINGGYKGYTNVNLHLIGPVSPDVAIAQAAHDGLSAMYPSQKYMFDQWLSQGIAAEKNPIARANGITLGKTVAAAVLATRVADGAEVPEPNIGTGLHDYQLTDLPGHWSWDPISRDALHQGPALGAHWGECVPFILNSGHQFRLPPPPAMTSAAYTKAFDDVKSVGALNSPRTAEQNVIALFWGYDGTPSLCAPPRLYNQITVKIGDQMHLNTMEFARLLALMNVAMADAGIASWDSKYAWDFWRPISGIRHADQDGNGLTQADPNFTPLGAPASNLTGPNFTPPFPSYPSGHATFGGAIFEVLRRFFGTDNIKFSFMSDEFNGETLPANSDIPRQKVTRTFNSLTDAEKENAQSRIYLGIHWQFDADDGIDLGRQVGKYVFEHAFQKK